MKRLLSPSVYAAVAAVLLLAACNPKVQFTEPMPPGRFDLPNIPRAFRGSIMMDDERWVMGKDTLWMGDGVLVNGEDFILRRMAGHLVFSQPVPETGHWEVFVINIEDGAFRLGSFDDGDAFLTRMGTLLEVPFERRKSQGTPGYGYALLDPSTKEFKAILKEGLYEADDQWIPLPRGEEVRPSRPTRRTN